MRLKEYSDGSTHLAFENEEIKEYGFTEIWIKKTTVSLHSRDGNITIPRTGFLPFLETISAFVSEESLDKIHDSLRGSWRDTLPEELDGDCDICEGRGYIFAKGIKEDCMCAQEVRGNC